MDRVLGLAELAAQFGHATALFLAFLLLLPRSRSSGLQRGEMFEVVNLRIELGQLLALSA
ncbi:hypothetical protein D3C72_2119060 [compost metagenome]